MKETDRMLQDSMIFSETLAASLSLFLTYGSTEPFKPCKESDNKIQILMGHTHNPQSRPYLNFAIPPFDLVPDPVKSMIAK